MPHVALRVWGKSVPADFDEAGAVDDAQRNHAAAMGGPQCGPAAGNPFVPWFREAHEHVRSMALVPSASCTRSSSAPKCAPQGGHSDHRVLYRMHHRYL